MSHSISDPKRAWDAGMRDDDFVSVVAFEQSNDSAVDLQQVSPIHFISVHDMRESFAAGQVSITQPKGFEEGSERRLLWKCAAANQRSVVSAVESVRISLTASLDARPQAIQLSRSNGKITLWPQVKAGVTVEANQILA